MWRLLLIFMLVITLGCRDEPPHPGQQAIDRAEKHADESAQQLEIARQVAKHQQRLRDIDKMKFDSELDEVQASSSVWKLWLFVLTLLLVIILVWLAREIRLRRVLAHILVSTRRRQVKGGDG